jgi:hypothetical protein
MEIPDLVRQALGDEEVTAGVNLGDEDLACLTPTRTLVYRGDGLLSDENVEEFPHTVERVALEEGRRKTKFVLEYVDGERSLTVANNRAQQVLELLLEGVLRNDDVVEDGESVTGVFRFSELSLVVTESRVVKHIGSAVWTADFEVYPFADLTGLSFEEGSVATEVVLEVDGRPQRIKTPNEEAHKVTRALESATFGYFEVESLQELNESIARDVSDDDGPDDATTDADAAGSDIDLGDGIEPLVTETDDEGEGAPMESSPGLSDTGESEAGTDVSIDATVSEATSSDEESAGAGAGSDSDPNVEALERQVEELTTAVQQQNDLLKKQHRTIKQLIDELRRGRGD